MIKIVVIDDEQYVTSMFSKLLNWNELDFEIVKTFASSVDAVKWLSENSCDVIFTDIAMPEISGTEIAKICHEKHPDILVVFFSAYRSFDYALEAIKYNVFDYILKPISYTALMNTALRIKKNIAFRQIEKGIKTDSDIDTVSYENDIICAANQFIKEHYCEEISIVDVARHVCLTPKYFSSYYKQKTNENFVTTLKKLRLEKAKELLRDRKEKITNIPHQIGFNSYSYFVKVFHDTFGENPSDYRDRIFNNGKGKTE